MANESVGHFCMAWGSCAFCAFCGKEMPVATHPQAPASPQPEAEAQKAVAPLDSIEVARLWEIFLSSDEGKRAVGWLGSPSPNAHGSLFVAFRAGLNVPATPSAGAPLPEQRQEAVARLRSEGDGGRVVIDQIYRPLHVGTHEVYATPTTQAVKVPLTREQIEPFWRKHCHAIGPLAVQDFNFATAIQRACAEAWGVTLSVGELG